MTVTPAQRIQEVADNNIKLLSRLEAILDEESQALRRQDMDNIHRVLDSKLGVLRELEISGREFIELASRHGIDPKNDDTANWLGAPELADTARRLRQQVAACEEKNRTNGGVIDLNRQFVENLLTILQSGHAPAARTYDRNGHVGKFDSSQTRATI